MFLEMYARIVRQVSQTIMIACRGRKVTRNAACLRTPDSLLHLSIDSRESALAFIVAGKCLRIYGLNMLLDSFRKRNLRSMSCKVFVDIYTLRGCSNRSVHFCPECTNG